MDLSNLTAEDVLMILAIMVVVGLLLSMLLAAWVFYRIRRINLPPDADFFGALRATPIEVVILLDLLDLSLDFLSAPVAWFILDRLGLKPLRAVSVVETLIPGTQLIPTMTAFWIVARIYKGPSPF